MRKSTNRFVIMGEILVIITQNGDVILADSEDYPVLSKYSWCISKKGYAVANINHKVTKMSRYILGANNPKDVIDHKNNIKLDNRKKNLRKCTQAENVRNRTGKSKNGFIGIRLTPQGKYNVRITIDRREIHIGNYDTLEEAIKARNEAEDKYHGEFGSHNN